MRSWYLLHTKPHKEPLVSGQLEDRGLDVFFPYLRLERGHGRGIRLDPFFPSYLFVKVDLFSPEASDLRWLPGVRTLVHFGGYPVSVPDEIVDSLRERLTPYRDKVLRKSEWLFKSGQRVEIVSGPFAGFEAVYQHSLSGGQRVQLLLDMMGSWTRTQLNVDQIRPAATH